MSWPFGLEAVIAIELWIPVALVEAHHEGRDRLAIVAITLGT
jgi:hypothetical protein